MADLTNLNGIFNGGEIATDDLPEVAPKQAQETVSSEMGGGGFKRDPVSLFPLVTKLGQEGQLINWAPSQNDPTVFELAELDPEKIGNGKHIEDNLQNHIVAVKFVLLAPRFGFSQTDHLDPNGRKNYCRTIAAFPDLGAEWNKFSDLPLEVPVYSPRTYDSQDKPKGEPEDIVQQKGLYGSKGMFCSECVGCGDDVKTVEDENGGEPRTVNCTAQSELFVAITHFGMAKKQKQDPSKADFEWVPYNKPYYEDQNGEALQLFNSPPIIRLVPYGNQQMAKKKPFQVWTQEHASANKADHTASYVPADVQNIAGYIQKLRTEQLPDGYSWVQVLVDKQGYYYNVYRGLHELWITNPLPDEEGARNCKHLCMMRGAEENQQFLDQGEVGARKLTKFSQDMVDVFWDQARTASVEQGVQLYEPWEPLDLKAENGKKQPELEEAVVEATQQTFNVEAVKPEQS